MREHRNLTPVEDHADQSIIIQTTPTPVLRGQMPGGFDYVCGRCEQSVLVENTIDGEIYDIAFSCANCGGLSTAPQRPPSQPLPKNLSVLPQGAYKTAQPDEIPAGAVLVSEKNARQYQTEIGTLSRGGQIIRYEDVLYEIIADVKMLLGDSYTEIACREKHWRVIGSPSGYSRHPLMDLIDRVRQMADSMVNANVNTTTLNTSSLAQLSIVRRLYQRFKDNPSWETLRKQAKAPHTFTHDILTLAFVEHLHQGGNGINILNALDGRGADIVGTTGSDRFIYIEVKTPQTLQSAGRSATQDEANKVVKDAFHKAQSTDGGQLSPNHAGLLVLGAWHLTDTSIFRLNRAIICEFGKHRKFRQHIAGVALIHFNQQHQITRLAGRPSGLLGVTPPLELDLRIFTVVKLTSNPHYTGNFHIGDS